MGVWIIIGWIWYKLLDTVILMWCVWYYWTDVYILENMYRLASSSQTRLSRMWQSLWKFSVGCVTREAPNPVEARLSIRFPCRGRIRPLCVPYGPFLDMCLWWGDGVNSLIALLQYLISFKMHQKNKNVQKSIVKSDRRPRGWVEGEFGFPRYSPQSSSTCLC